MKRKDILESFIYKIENDGLDYALESYSSKLKNVDKALENAVCNYTSARKNFLN